MRIAIRGWLGALCCALALVIDSAAPVSAQAGPAPGQIAGTLPAGGGYALVVWTGGTIDALITAANGRGCAVSTIWVTQAGAFVGYFPRCRRS
jgi:hypothetical protein